MTTRFISTTAPWIFIGAALFSLLTVFLSCARPGRIAAKVSPVDAVRYTEGGRTSGKRRARVLYSWRKNSSGICCWTTCSWP